MLKTLCFKELPNGICVLESRISHRLSVLTPFPGPVSAACLQLHTLTATLHIPHTLKACAVIRWHQRLQGNRFAIRAKNMAGLGKRSPGEQPEVQNDYSSKLLHLAWHPEANVIACAASNSLYMYCS